MAILEKRGKKGVWYYRGTVGGRRLHTPLHPDRRIAQEMFNQLEAQRYAGRHGHVPANTPWGIFKQQYLAWSKGTKNRFTVYHNTRAIRFLEDYRRISELDDITPALLEELRVHLVNNGYKKPGINRAIMALIAMMHRAEEWNKAPARNWRAVGRFKTARNRVDYYTQEEYDTLLKNCPSDYYRTLILLGGRAGLRVGEIYYLQWKDVDLVRGLLDVTPKPGIWAPKDYECRQIPLHPALKAHLQRWKQKARTPWVIADGAWRPADERALSVEYKNSVLRRLRLRGAVHILRHTFAAHAVMNRISLRKLKEWMGHADYDTTLGYAHLAPAEREAGMENIP